MMVIGQVPPIGLLPTLTTICGPASMDDPITYMLSPSAGGGVSHIIEISGKKIKL